MPSVRTANWSRPCRSSASSTVRPAPPRGADAIILTSQPVPLRQRRLRLSRHAYPRVGEDRSPAMRNGLMHRRHALEETEKVSCSIVRQGEAGASKGALGSRERQGGIEATHAPISPLGKASSSGTERSVQPRWRPLPCYGLSVIEVSPLAVW